MAQEYWRWSEESWINPDLKEVIKEIEEKLKY